VTDRLWAGSPEEAADALTALARRHRLSVTLHDVPQASDGARNLPRRVAAYRAIAHAAVGVAVNSGHERALLVEHDVFVGPVAVLPLPVDLAAAATAPAHPGADVAVLGYFYPGKGHDEALAAAHGAGLSRLTVLGRASDGHAADLDAFVRRADAVGVTVEVTGWLPDAAMLQRAREVGVPVIAHRHFSASGSLAAWIGAGRRPLAVRGRYIDEMAALRPGTVRAVDDAELVSAVGAAAVDPALTWHGLAEVPWTTTDVADGYRRWWAGVQT
jgi:glycosyltransferase involved in cell wall biosynthesis